MLEFVGYFVVGGLVTSLTTYYGARGKEFWAAFISMFPSMTLLIFFLIYRAGGEQSVINYAKSLAYLVPPWVVYVFAVAFLCDRVGIWWSLLVGILLYFCMSLGLNQVR